MVQFGLYEIKGSINVQLAEKTGFTEDDAEKIKECLIKLCFINDCSSARPDGSMEVQKIYCGSITATVSQYSSKKVHDSLKITVKEGVKCPESFDDYDIRLENFEDLIPEEINGI